MKNTVYLYPYKGIAREVDISTISKGEKYQCTEDSHKAYEFHFVISSSKQHSYFFKKVFQNFYNAVWL